MAKLTDIVALLSALAWPTAVVWIAYLFRAEIRGLSLRVSHLKFKELEASFSQELKDTETKVDNLPSGTSTLPPSAEILTKSEQLLRIAQTSPRAAILESWILIEEAAGKSGFIQGAQIPRINSMLFVESLIKDGKLPSDSVAIVEALRDLRNKASHLSDFSVSQLEAERYIKLAVKISSLIQSPS